ncbi:MAG: hypothetical protein J6Z04_06895 [Clostridia bacterium]|nr:hypothetical protein [Clostridia bacterium]
MENKKRKTGQGARAPFYPLPLREKEWKTEGQKRKKQGEKSRAVIHRFSHGKLTGKQTAFPQERVEKISCESRPSSH